MTPVTYPSARSSVATVLSLGMIVGGAGLLLSMLFWSSWGGPGYFGRRRETYVEDRGAPPPA